MHDSPRSGGVVYDRATDYKWYITTIRRRRQRHLHPVYKSVPHWEQGFGANDDPLPIIFTTLEIGQRLREAVGASDALG
jgi:hypothetical protein